MSLLTEILPSTQKIDTDDIDKKIPELKVLTDNLKSELIQYIDDVHIKYNRSGKLKENRKLLITAQQLEEEIKTLEKNAENSLQDLTKSSESVLEHQEQLDSIDFSLHVLSRIYTIHERLEEFSLLLQAKRYLKCKEIISNLEFIINEIPTEEKLMVIDDFQIMITENENLLLNKIRECFTEKLITEQKNTIATIKICCDIQPLDQALLAMFYNESSVYSLSKMSKFLWDNFFIPIVDNVVNVEMTINNNFNILQIVVIDSGKKSQYTTVFANIKLVLDFLQTNFNFPLTEMENAITTLEYIGLDIRDNLLELVIKHCLSETIPSTEEGLKNYNVIIEDTAQLEAALKQAKIFSFDSSLLEYANNIDFHFINKKCQEYLHHSTHLMKNDLHDMVETGVPYNPDNHFECELDQFLQCSVSKSVIELLNYCETILQRAITTSEMSAGRILITCQNILRNYTTVVPEYHKKLLKTIPQQVALYRNNCFYISNKLKDWNETYFSKMPSTFNLSIKSFQLEIDILEKSGSDTFTSYVDGQIKQINDIMKDSGLDGAMLEGDLKPITEKSVRQCLRQQELLKTVWHKVLSYPVYNKTLGTLLNSLCNCLIIPIVNFEDISSKSAEQLVEIIKIVISRGPKLFTDPQEVSLYVQLWYKLNEINFVLNASLMDINDRWADGKGPLALQFKPLELKSLIRALFQNTDRRAAILAKIQE